MTAALPGTAVSQYLLDKGASRFTVRAFAGGMLSAMGHNPTIAVRDFTGEVNVDTYNVVATTHPLFAESVRRVLRQAQFAPAIKQGHPVMQVVHQPFYFVPDTVLARRRR